MPPRLPRLVRGTLRTVTTATLAACTGATSPAAHADSGMVFALMDPGASTANLRTFAALHTVDGLAFRVFWGSLEPSAGSYNWTALDAAFAVVREQGKQMAIHVAPSDLGLPAWLGSLGMKSYSYTAPQGARTGPVPWDDVYLSNYRGFVAALGAHVQATGNMDLIASVSDPVPVPEMTIVGCQNGQLSSGIPYDRTRYLAACKAPSAPMRAPFRASSCSSRLPWHSSVSTTATTVRRSMPT